MNLNSQSSFYPPQPDNPSDAERYFLANYALTRLGWPEDFELIKHLMSPPPAITGFANPGDFKGKKVGVLGGGLAGLAAAYELRKLGFEITILDALEDRVGGRVYTCYFNRQKNLYGEFGPMRIPVIHETVWHYIKLLGLPTRPFIQYNPNGFVYLHGTRVRNDPDGQSVMQSIYPEYHLSDWEKNMSWQQLFYTGLESHLRGASPAERAEILEVKPLYSEKTLLWNRHSSLHMMEAAGLGQEAINLIVNFNALLKGNLYSSYIDFIQESYPADMSYLYEIPGGMAKLPLAFYLSFQSGNPYPEIAPEQIGRVCYKAGSWVTGIRLTQNGRKVAVDYEGKNRRKKVGEEFDYVVCALPFSTLRNVAVQPLFSNLKMRAIREVNYTTAQKTLFLCKERFWEREGIVGGSSYTDLPLASVWYPSDHAGCINNPNRNLSDQVANLPWNEPGVFIPSYNFTLDTTRLTNQPPEKRLADFMRETEAVHGLSAGYLSTVLKGYKTVNWDQEPTFRGSICFFTPEQKRIFSYGMTLPEYGDRVFFAGEHISAVHRWMQGALQSGMQAANDLAAACGKTKRT